MNNSKSLSKKISVLIVDDSPTMLEYTKAVMDNHPQLHVIGTAGNGIEAVESTKRLQPNVIVMDINMPKMNGFEAVRLIMEQTPTPVIMVSGTWDTTEISTAFLAEEMGALAVLSRPASVYDSSYEETCNRLIEAIITLSEVKVVRRNPKKTPAETKNTAIKNAAPLPVDTNPRRKIDAVMIGASTGGPLAVKTILSGLPGLFPFPIFIVQHITQGFINGFTEWLQQTTGLTVQILNDGETIQPGRVYILPDDREITEINPVRKTCGFSPLPKNQTINIDNAFCMISDLYGANAVGILLTGMGKDGALGLKTLHDKGAVTIAQDESSSVIFGMPNEAVRMGAATHVFSTDQIAQYLNKVILQQY